MDAEKEALLPKGKLKFVFREEQMLEGGGGGGGGNPEVKRSKKPKHSSYLLWRKVERTFCTKK